jgi:hypothetical protein
MEVEERETLRNDQLSVADLGSGFCTIHPLICAEKTCPNGGFHGYAQRNETGTKECWMGVNGLRYNPERDGSRLSILATVTGFPSFKVYVSAEVACL